MRTAQSAPSTTTAGRSRSAVPFTYRSIGSSAWRSSSTTAPAGSPTISADAIRARPSSAHTRTGMPASDGAPSRGARVPGRRAGAGRGDLGAQLVERAGHAHDEGVGHELDEPAGLAAHGHGGARGVRGAARRRRRPGRRTRRLRVSGHADLHLGAEHGGRRAGRGGHHLVHRLGDGGELELGELGRAGVRRRAPCPSSPRRACARPRPS